ncbi:MAG: hypothetical protein QGI08_12520 [Paracoccaceae bacterium]|jgi:hypothetical protein|nr:hypothetical protein [Paracoccaceae bacterium]MDP7186540.1 hypothetical protein [Paracoccaceae bacterium]
MQINELPFYDTSENTTGCCPRFKPDGWDGQDIHFDKKRFVKAKTLSIAHIPLNFGKVFGRVQSAIDKARAGLGDGYFVLSHDPSAFRGEHYFAVSKDVPGEDMVDLSGDYLTKVFEGPFQDAGKWVAGMEQVAREAGKVPKKVLFFYTTCPKCAKTYGENFVVGFVQV